MTYPASVLHYKPEFDDFLFAKVGEDRNGMFLSVVSVLARLKVDPWDEAAALMSLPTEAAIRRLQSLLATLPVEQSTKLDPATIAARLISLLPCARNAAPAARKEGVGMMSNPRVAMFALLTMSLLIALSLTPHHQQAPQSADAGAAASKTAFPRSSNAVLRKPGADAPRTLN